MLGNICHYLENPAKSAIIPPWQVYEGLHIVMKAARAAFTWKELQARQCHLFIPKPLFQNNFRRSEYINYSGS